MPEPVPETPGAGAKPAETAPPQPDPARSKAAWGEHASDPVVLARFGALGATGAPGGEIALAAAPDRLIPLLTGDAVRGLVGGNMALLMKEMRSSDGVYRPEELQALGALAYRYLKTTGDDPKRCVAAVETLLKNLQASGMAFTPENAGVLAGTLVAGLEKHLRDIDKKGAEARAERKEFLEKAFSVGSQVLGKLPGPWDKVAGFVLTRVQQAVTETEAAKDSTVLAPRLKGAVGLEWAQKPPVGPDGKPWTETEQNTAFRWLELTLANNKERPAGRPGPEVTPRFRPRDRSRRPPRACP